MPRDPIAYIEKENRLCWWCGVLVQWPEVRRYGAACADCRSAGVLRMTPSESLAFRNNRLPN